MNDIQLNIVDTLTFYQKGKSTLLTEDFLSFRACSDVRSQETIKFTRQVLFVWFLFSVPKGREFYKLEKIRFMEVVNKLQFERFTLSSAVEHFDETNTFWKL